MEKLRLKLTSAKVEVEIEAELGNNANKRFMIFITRPLIYYNFIFLFIARTSKCFVQKRFNWINGGKYVLKISFTDSKGSFKYYVRSFGGGRVLETMLSVMMQEAF